MSVALAIPVCEVIVLVIGGSLIIAYLKKHIRGSYYYNTAFSHHQVGGIIFINKDNNLYTITNLNQINVTLGAYLYATAKVDQKPILNFENFVIRNSRQSNSPSSISPNYSLTKHSISNNKSYINSVFVENGIGSKSEPPQKPPKKSIWQLVEEERMRIERICKTFPKTGSPLSHVLARIFK